MATGQSASGGGLLEGSQAKPASGGLLESMMTPTNTNSLSGAGQQQQPNLFESTTNANPLLGGKNIFGSSTLGTSTFGSRQQPKQQLAAGNPLSSGLAGGMGQQQNDPACQHANLTARFEGIYMCGTLLLLSVNFRYLFLVFYFYWLWY